MGALCAARDAADLVDEGRVCGVIEGSLAETVALGKAKKDPATAQYPVLECACLVGD